MSNEIQKELIQKLFALFHSENYIYSVLSALKEDDERKQLINFLSDAVNPSKTDVEVKIMSIRKQI